MKVNVSIRRAVSFLPARITFGSRWCGALVLEAIGQRAISDSAGKPTVVVSVMYRDGKNTGLASANIHGSPRLFLVAVFMKPADSNGRCRR